VQEAKHLFTSGQFLLGYGPWLVLQCIHMVESLVCTTPHTPVNGWWLNYHRW